MPISEMLRNSWLSRLLDRKGYAGGGELDPQEFLLRDALSEGMAQKKVDLPLPKGLQRAANRLITGGQQHPSPFQPLTQKERNELALYLAGKGIKLDS